MRTGDWGGPFSATELERSIPFDRRRGIGGQAGVEAAAKLLTGADYNRGRGRSELDPDHLRAAAMALLANLIVAARNRVDNRRFVSLSFRSSDYADCAFNAEALTAVRDLWLAEGFIEGRLGHRPGDGLARPAGPARRTRLRATPRLLERIAEAGVDRRHVDWAGPVDVIVLRLPIDGLAPEPAEVRASRSTLSKVSARIAGANVTLPDDAWSRVVERYRNEQRLDPAASEDRVGSGDTTAIRLYRVFKRDWENGGRLYGGWWINLPKTERRHLRIGGEPVVELDYGRLHPTILFARVGQVLDYDPYVVPGLDTPAQRALGKRTFNRLINKSSPARGLRPRLSPGPDDLAALPADLCFTDYLNRFVERLGPISDFFGSGEGLRLQREDSDLAVKVLDRMEVSAIPTLPVHDSFLAPRQHEQTLRAAMISSFVARYALVPIVR